MLHNAAVSLQCTSHEASNLELPSRGLSHGNGAQHGSGGVRQIVVADIGGTHARFAFASLEGARVSSVSEPVTLETGDYPGFETAWQEFGRTSRSALPDELAISFAGPVDGDLLELTNNAWRIRPLSLKKTLGIRRLHIINDFGAIGHAVSELGDDSFLHLRGPRERLPAQGVTTIIGPGTGLGVAQLLRTGEQGHVIATEGGHVDFAPLDEVEDHILAHLRRRFGRVSVERLVSGPGLANIHHALAAIEGRSAASPEDRELWSNALEGGDELAGAALDRFSLILAAVAGDLALAQGANGVVLAGALAGRIRGHLQRPAFADRFVAKGRFKRRLENVPVKLLVHPQPGLFGAAVALAREDR